MLNGVNVSSLIRNEARQEYMGDGLAKEMYIAGTRCTIPNKELIILGGCVHFRDVEVITNQEGSTKPSFSLLAINE